MNPDLQHTEPRVAAREPAGRTVFGIQTKLWLAFYSMAGLTIIASAVAWYAFVEVGRSVTHITTDSVPTMSLFQRLAEKSAQIAAAAPALMASVNQEERVREQVSLEEREKELVVQYLKALKASTPDAEPGFVSLEGYMVGRLVLQALEKLGAVVTREGLLATIARVGTFDLGGVTLTYGKNDNQGMDQVFLTVIESDGSFKAVNRLER